MNIHEEVEDLAVRHDVTIETNTESLSADEFDETWEFLEGTRNCYVGGFVYDGEGRLLLIRHADEPGWLQPGGMVELEESLEEALRREIREETGVEVVVEEPFFLWRGEYVHDGDCLTWYSSLFFAEAIGSSIGDDLGIDEEEIVDADWFTELPVRLHELASRDRFQQAKSRIDNRV